MRAGCRLGPLLARLAPLWGAGSIWCFRREASREQRFLGLFFLAILVPLIVMSAKNYYVTPAYPVLFAAGAVASERWLPEALGWARSLYLVCTSAVALAIAPLILPILPINEFLSYQSALGEFHPIVTERTRLSLMPQWFSDELGWEEMVKETARIYHGLPKAEQATTAIFCEQLLRARLVA